MPDSPFWLRYRRGVAHLAKIIAREKPGAGLCVVVCFGHFIHQHEWDGLPVETLDGGIGSGTKEAVKNDTKEVVKNVNVTKEVMKNVIDNWLRNRTPSQAVGQTSDNEPDLCSKADPVAAGNMLAVVVMTLVVIVLSQ